MTPGRLRMFSTWRLGLRNHSLSLLVVAAAVGITAVQAIRLASAAPDAAAVINACVTRQESNPGQGNEGKGQQGGLVHIVQSGTPCPRGEQALSWNVQGPPGP